MSVQSQASPATQASAASPLDEIRALVQNDLPVLTARDPQAGLRDFADTWRWLAASQHDARPAIKHPRVAMFLSTHGAFPEKQSALPQLLADLRDGKHAVAPLVREANADLQVYELDLAISSRDFRAEKALDAQEAAQAIAYGMMAVQPGVDLLVVCAPNPVADLGAKEITRALKAGMDGLDTLLRFGGFDIAAMAGAVVAARLARIPVVLEGEAAEAAAGILAQLQKEAADHTRKSSSLVSDRTDLPLPCRSVLLLPLLKSIAQVV